MKHKPRLLLSGYPTLHHFRERVLSQPELSVRMSDNTRDNQKWLAVGNASLIYIQQPHGLRRAFSVSPQLGQGLHIA